MEMALVGCWAGPVETAADAGFSLFAWGRLLPGRVLPVFGLNFLAGEKCLALESRELAHGRVRLQHFCVIREDFVGQVWLLFCGPAA
jgi:hypothetical protein